MRMSHLFTALLLTCVFISCSSNNSNENVSPEHLFKDEFKYFRYINLQRHLGDTLSIKNSKGVERSFLINFYKDGRRNVIRELGQGVHFEGTASKYKQIYWLNRKIDSFYQVFAFTFNDSSIIGFANFERQNQMVDSTLLSGYFQKLIIDTVNQKPVLANDRSELLKLYSTCLINSKPWQIVKD